MTADAQARYFAKKLAADPVGWRAHRARIAYEFRAKNPEKRKAWGAVARAVKRGDLVRPNHCASCSTAGRIEASHDDYSKPLDVEWLCRSCHANKDHMKDNH